jgi:hypothetical protein
METRPSPGDEQFQQILKGGDRKRSVYMSHLSERLAPNAFIRADEKSVLSRRTAVSVLRARSGRDSANGHK